MFLIVGVCWFWRFFRLLDWPHLLAFPGTVNASQVNASSKWLGVSLSKREVLSRKGKVSNGPPARNQLCKEISQGTWPWSPFNSAALALIWSRENRVEVVSWMSLLALECIEDCDLFIIILLYHMMYIALSCNSAAETEPGVQPILVKQFINKQCMLRPKPVGLFGGLISPDQPPWRILQPRTSSVVLCAELSKVVWDHNTAIRWGMSIFI